MHGAANYGKISFIESMMFGALVESMVLAISWKQNRKKEPHQPWHTFEQVHSSVFSLHGISLILIPYERFT